MVRLKCLINRIRVIIKSVKISISPFIRPHIIPFLLVCFPFIKDNVKNNEIFIRKEIKLVIYEETPIRLNKPKINEINNSISINKPIYLP